MRYAGETKRQLDIQSDIEFEKMCDWQDFIIRLTTGEPWRLVDNRDAYIKKRMALEGLK